VLEAPRVLLGGNRATVEEGRVHGADLGLGRDLDLDRDPLLQVRRISVERHDRVGVGRAGLRAVVGPLEALNRLTERREALPRRRVRLRLLERLQAVQPDRVAFGVIEALEAEAAAAGPLARGE